MIHTVIVPGVGGSETAHWQSWLQRQLVSSSCVQQPHWQHPVLSEWVEAWVAHVARIAGPVQIVAHSFGCLTSVAALAQYPQLQSKVKQLTLVAPANPARFGESGFARHSVGNYLAYFESLQLHVPTRVLLSENDPWFALADALALTQTWHIKPDILGAVGHINVASGFGAFPAIFQYILPEKKPLMGRFLNLRQVIPAYWAH